jgi:hypothetical protein
MRTLAVLAVLLSIPAGALADAERRCTRLKVKAAADYARAYYQCHADAAAVGEEPDFACLDAAGDEVEARVAEADALGPCPGTPVRVRNSICVPFLQAGNAACRAAKYRAAGWKFGRRLAFHGNGLRRGGPPRSGCFERIEARFNQRIARADALGSCGGTASHLESIIDNCAVDIATVLSCGNDRLDYGEMCEGEPDFCTAACFPKTGECCVTLDGCFQFNGFIEECFFNGGIDVQQGICTSSGCLESVSISATRVCCQETGGGCSDDVAGTASELVGLASNCFLNGIPVVGTCGADGRCVASSEPPVALTTTTSSTSSSTSTSIVGTTTTSTTFPLCSPIDAPCGSCGTGTCMAPISGIPIGACVTPAVVGPCAETVPACGEDEICIQPGGVNECHALCF